MDEIDGDVDARHSLGKITADVAPSDLDGWPPRRRRQLFRAAGQTTDLGITSEQGRDEPAPHVTRCPGDEDPETVHRIRLWGIVHAPIVPR